MTAKRITQDTFDAVVKENIEEFEMSPEEALNDAVEQFKSQGVYLFLDEPKITQSRSPQLIVKTLGSRLHFFSHNFDICGRVLY